MCIQHRTSPINLVALYTATRAERLAAVAQEVGGAMVVPSSRVNKLVSSYSTEEDDGPELTQAMQELCQQADGFILAVDASKIEGTERKRKTKTFSMPKLKEIQCHKLRTKLTLEGPLGTVNFMRFRRTVME